MLLPYVTVGWMRLIKRPRKYKSADMMQTLPYAYLFPFTRTERR
jgi:hypothetical protein